MLDTAAGSRYAAECPVPPWTFKLLAGADHSINQLEALAVVAARLTFPDVLYGRACLHFIDNTSALSAAVHGYSSKPDMAALTNMLHSIDAALRVDCYFEWVPSAANISDIPSRDPRKRTSDDVRIMAELDATRRVMRLPSPAQWRDLTLLLDAKTTIAGATLCPLRAQGAAPPS